MENTEYCNIIAHRFICGDTRVAQSPCTLRPNVILGPVKPERRISLVLSLCLGRSGVYPPSKMQPHFSEAGNILNR